MNNKLNRVLWVIFAVLAAGCASPQVRLHAVVKPTDGRGHPLFMLPGTQLKLEMNSDSPDAGTQGLKTPTMTFTKYNAPDNEALRGFPIKSTLASSSKGQLMAMESKNNVWSNTKLSPTFLDNSRRLRSVAVAFEDNTVKTIQAVDAIGADARLLEAKVTTGFGFTIEKPPQKKSFPIPADGSFLTFPLVLDLSDQSAWGRWKDVPMAKGWSYTITLPDGVERGLGIYNVCELMKVNTDKDVCDLKSARGNQELVSDWLSGFPVPSCIDVDVKFKAKDDTKSDPVIFSQTIADPVYVELLPLPAKGTLTMHTICGADLAVETETDKGGQALAELQAAFDAAKAIKGAQDSAAKNTDKSTGATTGATTGTKKNP